MNVFYHSFTRFYTIGVHLLYFYHGVSQSFARSFTEKRQNRLKNSVFLRVTPWFFSKVNVWCQPVLAFSFMRLSWERVHILIRSKEMEGET